MKVLRSSRVAVALGLAALMALVPSAANAGTLTSATFTTSGTGYQTTGAKNVAYNLGFTTATSGVVSKATFKTDSAVGATGAKSVQLNGTNGNYVTTPSSAANTPTDTLDIKAKIAPTKWASGTNTVIASKWSDSGNQHAWIFRLSYDGKLATFLAGAGNGNEYPSGSSQNPVPFADGSPGWVRAIVQTSSGYASTNFYYSADGTNWTNMPDSGGANISGSTIYPSTTDVEIGNSGTGTGGAFKGQIYFTSVAHSISGTTSSPTSCASTGVKVCFDPSGLTNAQAASGTWTSASPSAEPWTVVRSGATGAADIAADLTVASVSGLAKGVATYRYADALLNYQVSNPVSVPASTVASISLGGLNNTSTAGSYAAIITTFNNAATPASIDSVTTATLAFTDMSSSAVVGTTVDPTFSLTIGNKSTACNGESGFVTAAGASNAVALARISGAGTASGAQAILVGSNAGNGFAVYLRGAQASQNLQSPGRNWTDAAGTYASPAALGAGEAFGYTYKDATSVSSVINPSTAAFAALDATNRAVLGSSSSLSGSGCVAFSAKATALTTAGTYSATVIYTAVPTF